MTGKLYFAQVDLTYTMTADSYDVAVTRNLSEAITGYETEKKYVYGMVKGISFGGIFMDVDIDSHSVASFYGNEEAKRVYLFTPYLILNRNGTGAYRISGSLNGGSTCEEVT